MTKKDFELIAAVLAAVKPTELLSIPELDYWFSVSETFADALENRNPNFDRKKFLDACGWENIEGE